MNELNNPEYYDRRARHAQELAERAKSDEVRRIHLDLAVRYSALHRQTAGSPVAR